MSTDKQRWEITSLPQSKGPTAHRRVEGVLTAAAVLARLQRLLSLDSQ